MKEYGIYKKRDGGCFELIGSLFASNFNEAKKKFALNMTNDNWDKSNNIVWLYKDEDGVSETGWYDLEQSTVGTKPDPDDENYDIADYANAKMELFCSEKSILEGFDSWNADVYTWEIRNEVP